MKHRLLCSAIEDLIKFFRPTGSEYWIDQLREVLSALKSDTRVDEAANKLENLFGGMCSLNDLYFCKTNENLPTGLNEQEFNERFNCLMDKTFKELRLRNSGILTRLHWIYIEWKHRRELPPRIKKTFR